MPAPHQFVPHRNCEATHCIILWPRILHAGSFQEPCHKGARTMCHWSIKHYLVYVSSQHVCRMRAHHARVAMAMLL